jgi:hypothetical protein
MKQQREFVPVLYCDAMRYFDWDKERIKKEYTGNEQLFITDAPNGRLDLLYQKTPTTLGYLTTK